MILARHSSDQRQQKDMGTQLSHAEEEFLVHEIAAFEKDYLI